MSRGLRRNIKSKSLLNFFNPGSRSLTKSNHDRAIDHAGFVLQPVVDNILVQMGLAATIIVYGPIPATGGSIEAYRSV